MGKSKGCTGIMGDEPVSLLFWSLIVILFVLVIGNFILTLSIISFFKIGFGMEAIELVPEHKAIKFYGNTGFETVYKKDGLIEGFKHDPMVIESDDGEIKFNLVNRKGKAVNHFFMNNDGIVINGTREFLIKDPKTNKLVFSTTSNLKWNIEKPMKKLETTSVHGVAFSSPIDQKLQVESLNMYIQGAEGTKIDGKTQLLSADKNVYFKSYNGSIILDASTIMLSIERLPIVNVSYSSDDYKYKLCICYPKGLLYRAPISKELSKDKAAKYDACKNVQKHFCH